VSLSDLPLASRQKTSRRLEGKFEFQRRRSAEHIILISPAGQVVSIPNHREVRRPTLRQVLRTCAIDDKDYRKAFDDL
jgi:hypothetical protein